MAPKDSSYTQDVIARGLQAVRDRRSANSGDRTQWQDAFNQVLGGNQYVGNRGGYDQFAQARGMNPGNYEVRYGQTDEGDYSGFKNASDLWNAVEGKARMARDEDQLKATAMQQLIDKRLGYIEDGYTKNAVTDDGVDRSRQQHMPSPGAGNMMDEIVAAQPLNDQSIAPEQRILSKKNAPLNEWLATTSEPYMQALETMQAIQQAPITDYTAMAGAEYGVDPNIMRGRFDEQVANNDFRTLRDQESINNYGAPYSEYQSAMDQMQREGEQQDQQAVEDDQAAQDQQMDEVVRTRTTYPLADLAQMSDASEYDVFTRVNSTQYDEYDMALQDALASGSPNPNEIQGIFDEIRFADPILYRVLAAQYGDLIDFSG